jgi:hypothetical protein
MSGANGILFLMERMTMMNLDEIFEEAAREERELMEAWSTKPDSHEFDYELDDEVLRCYHCGMNALSVREYRNCEEWTTYNNEKNRRFRELAGL